MACPYTLPGAAKFEVLALEKEEMTKAAHKTNQEEQEECNIPPEKWKCNYVTTCGPYTTIGF